MNNTLDYRVAILLTAQSRTYKICLDGIIDFFNREKTENGQRFVKIDYFMHTWTSNQWTEKGSDKPNLHNIPYEPASVDIGFIQSKLPTLRDYIIEDYNTEKVHNAWGPGLYSFFKANQLKSLYEYKHNFTYDLVIKLRMDQVWSPNQKFLFHDVLENRFIYSASPFARIKYELNSFNLDDVWFFGDSPTMNIASQCYNYVGQMIGGESYIKNDIPHLHKIESMLGPGAMMNRFINQVNIHGSRWIDPLQYIIVRKEALDNNWTYWDNYPYIFNSSRKYYNL